MPFFSIIIPTYNRAHTVGKTLESCLGQDFSDFEIIVVDDGSTDNTREVVNAFRSKKVQLIPLPVNQGVNIARNRGAASARGEWLIFQDSDDTFTGNALELLKRLTQSGPELVFSSCVTPDGRPVSSHPDFSGQVSFKEYLGEKYKGEYLPMVRRKTFLKVMHFEDIRGGEGICWNRIAGMTGKVYISSEITRIYDNRGTDRLSLKGKNYCRLAGVFAKDLEVLAPDYLRHCPMTLVKKTVKYLIYRTMALFNR